MIKKRHLLLLFAATLLCILFSSCHKYDGFKKHSGFYYKFHTVNPNNEMPQTGDFVVVDMALRVGDSTLTPMNHYNMLMDELYKGDIYSALHTMHLGDSATFIFEGKKFYEEFLGLGEYPNGKTPIFADIKLLKIMSKQSLENAEEQFEEHKKQMAHIEDSLIIDYVDKYHIDNKISGIYCIYKKIGSGEKPEQNQVVEILYKSYRLDNTLFDCSVDPDNPLSFELGKGQIARAIDIMVSQMSVGDEILMVVPSSLAFGDRGNEQFNILPYTPVVFDVELLNILPPKQ